MEKIERLYLIVFFCFFLVRGAQRPQEDTSASFCFCFFFGRRDAFERSLSLLSFLFSSLCFLLCRVPELLLPSLSLMAFFAFFSDVLSFVLLWALLAESKTIKQFILLFFLLSFHYPLLTFKFALYLSRTRTLIRFERERDTQKVE